MQNFTPDPNDVESEDTIYFDKSDKLLFKTSINEDIERSDVQESNSISHSPQSSGP